MYYAVIDENCHTCGHKHKNYGEAVDCFDKIIDFTPCNDEPFILKVTKSIPLQEVGYLRTAWEKYGDGKDSFQEFVDKWMNWIEEQTKLKIEKEK